MSTFSFELIHTSSRSRARVGRIHTPHGIIDTPHFVPVGTNGTLKALDNVWTQELGVQLMFCNTYHLLVQPGTEVVKNAGGLHQFINRSAPIITDSGGFQVFSLASGETGHELKSRRKRNEGGVLKINEEGVLFRSYRDGRKIFLSPETSVAAQKDLGADIIIPFDELPAYDISLQKLKVSLDRTHRWEKRSLDAHRSNPHNQAMYAVVHGGVDYDLRAHSCHYLSSLPFDGFAIGGSLGRNREEMFDLLDVVMPRLPEDKPNHLLGIADYESLHGIISRGVDTFDSSYPTRAARHGVLLTREGLVRILRGVYATSSDPIEQGCMCYTCRHYTRGYLHHLFKAREMTSMTLATVHNVAFMVSLMRRYREMILRNEV